MTNKEIISGLRGLIGKYNLTDEEWQTIEKTIKVLNNSDGDCISREQALRIAEQGQVLGYEWQFRELCKLPSIQPKAKTDFEHKAEIVISQLRADRDRLQDAIEKIRGEIIETFESSECAEESGCLNQILEIIDKYTAESEE